VKPVYPVATYPGIWLVGILGNILTLRR